ncbi:SsrA-binding protein [Aliamphritea spongicola]|nr:SsrA-binding protein [Aliamphritea spongicola]
MAKKKSKPSGNTICQNKKPVTNIILMKNRGRPGINRMGSKSLRDGRAQLVESYVIFDKGEAWLIGAHFTPLKTACTHVIADPTRPRKLLMHARQISKLFAATQAKGYTCVALGLYWKNNKVKCEVALARGKSSTTNGIQKRTVTGIARSSA